LSEAFDNLKDHLEELDLNEEEESKDVSAEDQFAKNMASISEAGPTSKKTNARRLTVEERNEGRGMTLVKQKTIKEKAVSYEDFKILMVLGRGAFGKVFLAELKHDKKLYAIKSIRKDILIEMDQVENTLLEKDIMFECDHPFLVGMEYLFQNDLRLYFIMPFVRGGELYKIY
jgi:serine/threonine protein kinase